MGSELSVCCSAVSLIVFVELCLLAKTRAPIPLLILLFKIWPATLIHSSVTLRESYQILGILCVGWALTKLNVDRKGNRAYLILFFGVFLLFNLHRGLSYYALLLAGVAYLRWLRSLPAVLFSCCLALGLLVTGLKMEQPNPAAFQGGMVAKNESQFEFAARYREYNTGGRASYKVKIDLKSPHGFVWSLALCLFYYMFAPLPWMISGLTGPFTLWWNPSPVCFWWRG